MKLPKYVISLLSALLFTLLFFEQSLGLNVALYAVGTILFMLIFNFNFFKANLNKIVAAGYLLTSIFYFLYGSPVAFVLALISFFMLIGLHTSSGLRNILSSLPNSLYNYGVAISSFFGSFRSRKRKKRSFSLSKQIRIIFLPLFIILLFVALYSMGSSFFSDIISNIGEYINRVFEYIAKYININAVGVAILGLFFGFVHSLGLIDSSILRGELRRKDVMERFRKKYISKFRNLDLKYEYKSAIFLFASLNLLLVLLLYVEMKNVWFGFEWEGEFLKSMVHEGTYVLIFSILVSIAVTVYFFRRNLNFLKNNARLKQLATVWIGLNGLLIVSVFVRNAYYIQHFALAYRRIGVVIFLILCLVGLITIILKVHQQKTIFFLVRTNALAAYIVLVLTCAINWDVYIAKYNFAHQNSAFIHLPFMADLSDKALPYLKLDDTEIEEIEKNQQQAVPFARKGYFKEVNYKEKIDRRIEKFLIEQKDKSWLEMVWAEKKAFEQLSTE